MMGYVLSFVRLFGYMFLNGVFEVFFIGFFFFSVSFNFVSQYFIALVNGLSALIDIHNVFLLGVWEIFL